MCAGGRTVGTSLLTSSLSGPCPCRMTFPCCPIPACKVYRKCVERTWQTVQSTYLHEGARASAGEMTSLPPSTFSSSLCLSQLAWQIWDL